MMAQEDDTPRLRDESTWDRVRENQNLIWAFLGGIAISWVFGGMQGDNSGWLMLASVIGFYIILRRTKRSLPTIADVVLEIADDQKRLGLYLDIDPRNLVVLQLKKDKYVFGFKNQKSFIWEGKLARGSRAMMPQSAESVRLDYFNRNLEMGYVPEVEPAPKRQ